MTTAYIGLGSNLGNRESSIRTALKMLTEADHIAVTRVSDVFETEPLGRMNQPKYLNAVAEIKTDLSAQDLHKKLIDIETSLGRVRKEKWSPRIIDLDLLLFDQEVINHRSLTVPHPQMHLRSFVLKGLCQLDSNLVHPVIKESMGELAARLSGYDFLPNPELPQLVCLAGIIGVGKTTLAKKLSQLLDCKLLLEPYDANPFMPYVYAGRKDLALDSQLFFLTSRTEQLKHSTLEPRQIAITDYIFDKELIYARQLLNTQQLALYEKMYPVFNAQIARPVLVIYLQDSEQNCLKRIKKRNRPYEQAIEIQFLEELDLDYEQLFRDWKTCPIIRKQMSEFDYTQDGDIEHLAKQITSYVAI